MPATLVSLPLFTAHPDSGPAPGFVLRAFGQAT